MYACTPLCSRLRSTLLGLYNASTSLTASSHTSTTNVNFKRCPKHQSLSAFRPFASTAPFFAGRYAVLSEKCKHASTYCQIYNATVGSSRSKIIFSGRPLLLFNEHFPPLSLQLRSPWHEKRTHFPLLSTHLARHHGTNLQPRENTATPPRAMPAMVDGNSLCGSHRASGRLLHRW